MCVNFCSELKQLSSRFRIEPFTMGITRQYLRHEADSRFGLIASNSSPIRLLVDEGKAFCCTSGGHSAYLWNLRSANRNEIAADWSVQKQAVWVSCFAISSASSPADVGSAEAVEQKLAVGYSDGTVRVFAVSARFDEILSVKAHKSKVSALDFDLSCTQLLTGSMDTHIALWDLVERRGVFKLKGHSAGVTQARFLQGANVRPYLGQESSVAITASKDTYLKFWHLATQHCFQTVFGHRNEIWDFVLCAGGRYLISGATDTVLKVWRLTFGSIDEKSSHVDAATERKLPKINDVSSDEARDKVSPFFENFVNCTPLCDLTRRGRGRLVALKCVANDLQQELLALHGRADKSVELWKIDWTAVADGDKVDADELFHFLGTVDFSHKLSSMDLLEVSRGLTLPGPAVDAATEADFQLFICCHLANNQLEMRQCQVSDKELVVTSQVSRISQPGHRKDAIHVQFSQSNSNVILSASPTELKLWSRSRHQCLNTVSLPCNDSARAVALLPHTSDRYVAVAFKSGAMAIYDMINGDLAENCLVADAHSQPATSLFCLDNSSDHSFLSAGQDKLVKFWCVTTRRPSHELTLSHKRSLQLDESITCIHVSASGKLLLVGLLDNTCKVFFVDTLKFFLNLYGHKLPVSCLDVSKDGRLAITGSADKNIRIWGLDFGDCHRSLFGHDDSVTGLGFVSDTHLFWSCGRDGKVRQWDADTFQPISTVLALSTEIWAMDVSACGVFVAAAAHDGSIRVWHKTEEPLIIEEEAEAEREKADEEDLLQEMEPIALAREINDEVTVASHATLNAVTGAEQLMNAMDYLAAERHAPENSTETSTTAAKHPLLVANSCSDWFQYCLMTLDKIPAADLERALLMVPFEPYVRLLLDVLADRLESFSLSNRRLCYDAELICKTAMFLLRLHHSQISLGDADLMAIVRKLRRTLASCSTVNYEVVAYNLAALNVLKDEMERRDDVQLFAEIVDERRTRLKKRKKNRLGMGQVPVLSTV